MTTATFEVIKTPEGDKRLEQLKKVFEDINTGDVALAIVVANTIRESGIISNMHVGKQKDNLSYFNNQQYLCEYFMGQILNLVENNAWFAMNSGLNIISSYLDKVAEEDAE